MDSHDNAGKHKIVCIGDQFTHGRGSSSPSMTYPAIMSQILDPEKFEVVNLGLGCGDATMGKSGDKPISEFESFKHLFESNANTVLIMLGTNDAKEGNWSEIEFQADYYEMIAELQGMDSAPRIFLLIPPPVYLDQQYGISQNLVNTVLPGQIYEIAKTMALEDDRVISVFDALGGEDLSFPEYFNDGVHPNDAGYFRIAEFVLNKMGLPTNISQNKKDWIEHLGHGEGAYYLQASGEQEGKVLSHAWAKLSLKNSVFGEGELWKLHIGKFPFRDDESMMTLFFQGMGGESNLNLSHSKGQMGLKSCMVQGEEFQINVNQGDLEVNKESKDIIFALTGGEGNLLFGRDEGVIKCLQNHVVNHTACTWLIKRKLN